MRRSCGSIAALLVLLVAGAAGAQSAYQLSRDGTLILIQKDVADERWVVFYDPQAGTIHGNVFIESQSEPAFLSCEEVSGGGGETTFRCYGAGACTEPPCRSYGELGEVTLSDSFLRPPAPASGNLGRILSRPSSPRIEAPAGVRASGIQLSHDGSLVFVQKDLATERWAILHDPVAGSVRGSVFSPSGDAVFLDCDRTAVGSDEATFDCFTADPCTAGSCQRYRPLGNVTLATSFLSRPRVDTGWAGLAGSSYVFTWLDERRATQERPIDFSTAERFIRLLEEDPFGDRISALEVDGTGIVVPRTTAVRIADVDPRPVVPFDFAMFFGSTMVLNRQGLFEVCEAFLFSVHETGEIRGRLAIPGPCSRSPVDVYHFMRDDCAADDDTCGIPVLGLARTG